MNDIIDDIIIEWAYRVKDGKPNPKSIRDRIVLESVLKDFGWNVAQRNVLLENLSEADENKPLSKNDKKKVKDMGLVWKGKGYGKPNQDGIQFKNVDGKLVAVDKKDDKKSGEKLDEPSEFERDTDSNKDISKDFERGDSEKDGEAQANGYVGDKDKSVEEGEPSETEEFQREPEPNDEEFEKRNEKHKNPEPPPPISLDGIIKNPKFPKRYIKMLERMMNSRLTSKTKKWEHFSDIAGGAGQIKAQAGELLTMIGSTLDDDEFEELMTALEDHEKKLLDEHPGVFKKKTKQGAVIDNPGSRIIDKTWIKSARNNRKAILDRLEKQYGEGTKIIGSSWDTKNEVEAMGFSDYENNKGFSTDCYFKVQKPDGEQVIDEVSLKKSTKVNFLNSGAGIFPEWDENLPDEINQEVYRAKARKRNIDYITQNKDKVDEFLNSPQAAPIKKLMESKGLTFEEAMKGNSRDKQNILFQTIKLMSKADESAKAIIQQDNKEHSEFVEKAVTAITENDNMREGMLNEIRSEFPLKAVSDGEETMAIGPNSLDKETMKNIFGTDDYDEIKEKLVAKPGPPPFIGYRVDTGDEVIPVAKIVIREDGRGYGGQFKFEMVLHDDFSKKLESAQKEIYG